MLEEIQRRNFTESTRRAYVRIIEVLGHSDLRL
jgi:hypothetical protein